MPTTNLRLAVRLAATVLVAALVLGASLADSGADDLERNREWLEKWRNDPAHLARLRKDLVDFLALPPGKQERLRKLDHDLHAEESAVQVRYWKVLERYSAWLDRLPVDDRQSIEGAPAGTERLQLIREVRQRQWRERLPVAIKQELERLEQTDKTKLAARLTELKEEEKRRRQVWELAIQHWDELLQNRFVPARREDLPRPVQEFVKEWILPYLTPEDRDRLEQAEGQWPLFPRTLVELVEKRALHPGSLGPTTLEDLPAELRRGLAKQGKNLPPPIPKAERKWPEFALAVTTIARKKGLQQFKPLGPARLADFPDSIQQFVRKDLTAKLTPEEKQQLKDAEGLWPEYPRALLRLARNHNLAIPGMMLPGGRDLWDKFRTVPRAWYEEPRPQVPPRTLWAFAETLSPQRRAQLRLSPDDPTSVQRIEEEWIRQNEREWQQIMHKDKQQRLRGFTVQ